MSDGWTALVTEKPAYYKDLTQIPTHGISLLTGEQVEVNQVPLSEYIAWGARFDYSLDMYVI